MSRGRGKLLANHEYGDKIKSDDDKVKNIGYHTGKKKLNGYIK